MEIFKWLVCLALVAGFIPVNGKNANNNEQQTKAVVPAKGTSPVLMVSTVSPTKAPKISSTSPKASTAKVTSKPGNATKKVVAKTVTAAGEKKPEVKSADKVIMMPAKNEEVKPIVMPATVVTEKSGAMKEMPIEVKAKEAKPLAVTGFITQNGNIYEIENKDGIGKIEGRQSPDEVKEHICNYGSVVVYSDLPCDTVSHFSKDEVQGNSDSDPKPVSENQTEMINPEAAPEQSNQNMDGEKENMDEVKPVRRARPNSKKPRRNNKNKLRKQQNKRRFNTRRVAGRPVRQQNQNQRRSQQMNAQQMKRRQQQRRRQLQNRRQKENQRRRFNNRPQYYDDYEDEEYEYNRGRDY